MPNPKTSEPDLVGLKALAEKVGAASWYAHSDDEGGHYVISRLHGMVAVTESDTPEDAAYIAAASPDVILKLLSRLLAAEAERDRLREEKRASSSAEQGARASTLPQSNAGLAGVADPNCPECRGRGIIYGVHPLANSRTCARCHPPNWAVQPSPSAEGPGS